MLSFKNYLLENRLDFLKQNTKTLSTDHDSLAQHKSAPEIIDHFATHADPTSKKTNTSWIVNQYKKGAIRQEDHPRIKSALEGFEKYKSKLPSKDINSYKSLSHLEDAVEPHLGSFSSNREEKAAVKHEGADLIHDGKNLLVHKLKTKEAACHYGAGTKWCTAARENNMFDHYNKEGPLYVVTNKNSGDKHQFHFETDQFMDKKDEPVKLHDFIQKNPELKDVKEFKNSNRGYEFAKNKEEFDSSMNKTLNDKNWNVRRTAIRHPKATPEHISKALNNENEYVREAAIKHPNVTPEHITKALNDENEYVRRAAIQHSKATPEHISKALNDEDPDVREAAIQHPKATSEHITKALNDEHWSVRKEAIQHPNVTTEHITKALDNKHEYIRKAAIKHPKATPEHVTKALNDEDWTVRYAAISHPSVTPEHITKALNDKDDIVRKNAIQHPKATPEHITKALDDKNENVREAAIKHPKATPEHITKALNDKNESVRKIAKDKMQINY